jgi:hypothetical protein
MVTKDCDKGCRGKHSRKFPFFRNPFVFVVLWLVLAVAIGAIIMLLWNWLMPVIFGLPVLSLWQALGLFVLTRILFGSFGFGRRGMPGRGGNPVHEKWMHMTPEQRREFIKKRKHMGFGPWDRPSEVFGDPVVMIDNDELSENQKAVGKISSWDDFDFGDDDDDADSNWKIERTKE